MIGSGLRPRFLTMLVALCLTLFFRPALNLELIYLESPFLNRAGALAGQLSLQNEREQEQPTITEARVDSCAVWFLRKLGMHFGLNRPGTAGGHLV